MNNPPKIRSDAERFALCARISSFNVLWSNEGRLVWINDGGEQKVTHFSNLDDLQNFSDLEILRFTVDLAMTEMENSTK